MDNFIPCGYRTFTLLIFHSALFLCVFCNFRERSLVMSDHAWYWPFIALSGNTAPYSYRCPVWILWWCWKVPCFRLWAPVRRRGSRCAAEMSASHNQECMRYVKKANRGCPLLPRDKSISLLSKVAEEWELWDFSPLKWSGLIYLLSPLCIGIFLLCKYLSKVFTWCVGLKVISIFFSSPFFSPSSLCFERCQTRWLMISSDARRPSQKCILGFRIFFVVVVFFCCFFFPSVSQCFQFVCRAILLPWTPIPRAEDYVLIQHMYLAWNAKSVLLEE